MNKTQKTQLIDQSAYITTQVLVAIDAQTVVATPHINQIVTMLQDLDRQEKALAQTKKKYQDIIKNYMQDSTKLLGEGGELVVTWKQDKDSLTLDKDTLKLMYPQAYKDCLFLKPGARKFCLK